jgi:retinol-binding protein 3
MIRGLGLILVFVVSVCGQPAIPDTPAGRTLRAWFDAFNSGDRAKIEAYIQKHDSSKSVEAEVGFRDQTGGFELLSVDKTERTLIEFQVKEKLSPTTAIGKIEVKDAEPPTVVRFYLRAIPPGVTAADFKNDTIDGAARARVIDGIAAKLNEHYVFPETAKKMEEAIRSRQKRGEYDSVVSGESFATMLTDHLREVSKDKHLRVNYSPVKLPQGPPPRSPDASEQFRKHMERINCGFEKAERLPPNIGYLKFNMFANPEVCGSTAIAAMNFLGNVDAIIFDLRDNGGGDPKMIAMISTYLFGEATHLNDIYNRKEDSTTQYWTLPFVPGKKLTGKPVFVLTSRRTFSGAEEFSYNLKNLKRGTIVGETTGGGAHPVSGQRVDDHFMVGVPFARAVNPISKTNWEGTGVEPDVSVPAAEALDVAKKLAAEQLKKK